MIKPARQWQLFIVLGAFWTLLGLSFAAISYFVAAENNSSVSPWITFSLNLIKFYLWFAFAPLIYQIVKRFGFDRSETFFVNFVIHIAVSFLFAGVHTVIYLPLVLIFEGYPRGTPTIATLFQDYLFFGNFFLNVLLYAIIVIAIQAYLLYTRYLAEETRSSKLKAELADARLRALKMQLQPHFLFNTLHSISSLNLVDPPKANQMIARLGEFLRMTLESSEEQMVGLSEEIEYLRCYLEIEQIRFSDRLTVRFEIETEALTASVPHLILQPLVENAVKYGIAPYAAPGEIIISARKMNNRLLLKVSDNCAMTSEKSIAKAVSSGKGVQNVRSRLKHLYENESRFEMLAGAAGGMTVELEIPFAVEESLNA